MVSTVVAQDGAWQPNGQATHNRPDAPTVVLGRPIALEADAGSPGPAAQPLVRVSYDQPAPAPVITTSAQPGAFGGQPIGPPTSRAIAPSPAEQYNCGVATQAPDTTHPFWDKTRQLFGGFPWFGQGGLDTEGRHHLFESDHAFDDFASPVSNPIYFEDPRSLTELRPMFLYQETPTGNHVFHGGDIEFLNLQGRVAITECWSLVVSEFGAIWMEPHSGEPGFEPHDGFAQITLGPKWTFLRNESWGTIAATGLNFVIPAGDAKVFQDTGSLSLEPYISAGQRFCKIPNWGTFHAMGTTGFNFAVDNERSDNWFLSLHLDFDVGDLHKIYPMIELNNFLYISNGKVNNLNFEGRDLANFGSTHVSGHDELSMALGMRYKFNECIQTGFAFEFPLTTNHDLMSYRLTFDLIFRY
jgi:hypothetical protein